MNSAEIQHHHDLLTAPQGWGFMGAPEATLKTSPHVIVGLNPGGTLDPDPKMNALWDSGEGSTWLHQRWRRSKSARGLNDLDERYGAGEAPLQLQVQAMARLLDIDLDKTFSAQFVPFRSARWADMKHDELAVLAFARKLWRWTLDQSPAHTFICIGKKVSAPEIAALLGAVQQPSIPAGWGNVTIDRYISPDNKVVVGLPHLSTFKLFSRHGSESDHAFLCAVRRS